MTDTDVPHSIVEKAAAFAVSPVTSIVRITDGSINETFEVTMENGDLFVLQGMSSIFKPNVIENLLAVQPMVSEAGVSIPTCLPTHDGDYYLQNDTRWYRALTYIPGVTVHKGLAPESVESAAELVGRFHSALANCTVELSDPLKHYHDNTYYMERMQRIQSESTNSAKHASLDPLVKEVLERYTTSCAQNGQFPKRIIHNDLKVSNIRFDDDMKAVGIIDLDTMTRDTIQIEMGDALRSWCGTAGEDGEVQVFDIEIFEAAMAGYANTATDITDKEVDSIPEGIRQLALGLACRFVTDAFEESYFALLHSEYSSLYEQNKTRAENQLKFLNALENSGVLR